MKNTFKWISYAEAASFLFLLCVAMPMKYFMDMPAVVKYTGWAHGLLFVAYLIVLVMLASEEKWPTKKTIYGFIASVIPLGPIYFHKKYLNSDL